MGSNKVPQQSRTAKYHNKARQVLQKNKTTTQDNKAGQMTTQSDNNAGQQSTTTQQDKVGQCRTRYHGMATKYTCDKHDNKYHSKQDKKVRQKYGNKVGQCRRT